MDATLHAIERRLTPGQLVDQGLDYLRHSGGKEFVSNLGHSVQQNPLPVALVGVGLAWLMMGGRKPHYSSGASTEELASRATGAVSSVRESVGETATAVRERFDAARGRAEELGKSTRQQIDRARSSYERMVREQPLALGAIGLAIGAILAAAAPRTRQEDRLMGAASDRVTGRAKEIAEESLETARKATSEAARAVTEEARRQTTGEQAPGRQHEQNRSVSATMTSQPGTAMPRETTR
jgi:ElaB/YqjD/DUF883 family membrane-anchored ribosome-binding protein